MADVLQMVDPAALATVRYDLNDYNGTSGTKLRAGVQTGDVESDNEILQQGAAATAINTEYPPVFVTLPVTVYGTSASNLRTKLRTLAREARRGGTLKRQLDSDAAALYRDFFPSNAPTLLNGELPEFQTLDNNVWQGTVTLLCQADWYAADETLANATAKTNAPGQELEVTTTGTEPSPARIEIQVDSASAEAVQFRFGILHDSDTSLLDAFETDDPATDTTITFGSNTAKVDDVGNVSGDKYGRVSYTATGYFLKRFRKEINTASLPASEYRIYLISRITAGSKQTLQLRWGMKDSDPVDFTNEEVVLDAQEAAANLWIPVDLGKVRLDADASVLVLELWSRLDVDPGSSLLEFDYCQPMPTGGKVTTATVLGFRGGAPAKERILGEDLTTPTSPAGLSAGSDNETTKVLDAQNEAAGAKPNTGIVYPAGKVRARLSAVLKQNSGDARQKLGEFRIRDVTAGANEATRDLYTRKNRVETDIEKDVIFTADGTSAYQVQVVFTKSSPDSGEQIIVENIRTFAVRTVGNGDTIVLDHDPEESGIYSSGVKVADIIWSGALPVLEPGDNTFVFQVGDWSGGTWQDDVDEREPLAKLVWDRGYDVTVKATPHHSL